VLIWQDALVYPEPRVIQVLKQVIYHQQKYKVETANLSANYKQKFLEIYGIAEYNVGENWGVLTT
jgi:hypothetical protein